VPFPPTTSPEPPRCRIGMAIDAATDLLRDTIDKAPDPEEAALYGLMLYLEKTGPYVRSGGDGWRLAQGYLAEHFHDRPGAGW
jgi:hypothetical protein